MSKNTKLPPEDPPPPSPQKKGGPRKKSRKSDDKGKGAGKRRPTTHPGKAPPPGKASTPGNVPPPGKKPMASQKGKKPLSGGKKPAKKKKGHSIYTELQMNSDEEDISYRQKDTDVGLASDLGWDPTAYYPHPSSQQPAHPPALSKHINVRGELSSPLMMHQSGECKLLVF